jgi:hypothetical protein
MPGAIAMVSIPALHVQTHVEPFHAGSQESHVPLPRIDTPGVERGDPQAQAEHPSRDAGTAAGGVRPPVGSRAAWRQSAAATPLAGPFASTLPDAYIGTPQGDLRSDPRHAGMLTDESGQRYIAAGQHYYAIRNDEANRTWRAVQLQDQTKPGIPVEPDPTGKWRVRHDVGLAGGRPLRTHAQIETDLRETLATLEHLLARRFEARQGIRDAQGQIRRYQTFQAETRAEMQSISIELGFWQRMSEFFEGAAARNQADPSFQTAREQARLHVERRRTSMQARQRIIEEADQHIVALRARTDAMRADLEHISESNRLVNQRIEELAAQLDDFE